VEKPGLLRSICFDMAEFMVGREAYYNIAEKLLKDSRIFYVYCKTPTIFMSSQRVYEEQRRFYQTFLEVLKRDIDIKYVFSLPLVKDDILDVAKKNRQEALSILDEWNEVSENPKIQLRFIEEKNPFSFLVYDEKTIFLAVYPDKNKISEK
jgi:hypothetical protein